MGALRQVALVTGATPAVAEWKRLDRRIPTVDACIDEARAREQAHLVQPRAGLEIVDGADRAVVARETPDAERAPEIPLDRSQAHVWVEVARATNDSRRLVG